MRHLCLAVVPPDRATHLRSLDRVNLQWLTPELGSTAADVIRNHPVDLAVLDPMIQDADVDAVEHLRAQFPSLPIVLYTVLSPTAAAVLLRLGRAGIRRVVFARFEDAPESLRRIIKKELEQGALQQVMRALHAALEPLPEVLRVALEASLHTPEDRISVTTLAQHAHLSPYECQAHFARAELPAPRVVIALSRLLYAHRLLLDPGHTVDDVARKLGYTRARTLQAQLRVVFGMTGGELRESLSPIDAANMLVDRYFHQAESVEPLSLMAAPG